MYCRYRTSVCGSGSGLEPDSMESLIRIQQGKNYPQNRKKLDFRGLKDSPVA
jgi:hypothetical protein